MFSKRVAFFSLLIAATLLACTTDIPVATEVTREIPVAAKALVDVGETQTVEATNGANTTAEVTREVTKIIYFDVCPRTIEKGEKVNIAWKVVHADLVLDALAPEEDPHEMVPSYYENLPKQPLEGYLTVTPDENTFYVLYAITQGRTGPSRGKLVTVLE